MLEKEITEKEKALLDLAYTDGERISEGKLFDYQEKALTELRAASFYLSKRYPKEDLEIISFQPSAQQRSLELRFLQVGNDTEYMLRYEDGNYTDNFYDVPFEKEYDEIVEGILRENGISARVYTTFPFLISDEIHSGRDLLERRPHLGRNTELFLSVKNLPSYEEGDVVSERVREIFEENGIYTSGMIFFILQLDQLGLKNVLELDAYARDRKNLRSIVSVGFRCFHVKE